MSMHGVGVILLWLGTLLLVAVLQYRLRKGAWSEEAFANPPPIARWAVAIAAGGMILAAVGGGLVVWGLW
ncbi:hypothetical protein [Magnetospirillum aberrantis]|uniref:Uncharacterized protein n=1 Tax=Magnetospirillum aberrantis SpK TaxID=908842 RepID=A0A7C9QSW9_9PROT|nr:hypothetical protein [Magnetospirillum aberrantis]NFV79399.1 hypothetical protein [Magnetospirillum aberrantis SpK]